MLVGQRSQKLNNLLYKKVLLFFCLGWSLFKDLATPMFLIMMSSTLQWRLWNPFFLWSQNTMMNHHPHILSFRQYLFPWTHEVDIMKFTTLRISYMDWWSLDIGQPVRIKHYIAENVKNFEIAPSRWMGLCIASTLLCGASVAVLDHCTLMMNK